MPHPTGAPTPPRPTFSDLWHRVARSIPRLATPVRVHRQRHRGETWHIAEDPASNRFYRLNTPGYRFVALLDGSRTVDDAWRAATEQLGDEAPTQGEAIQILAQLHEADLLYSDDAAALEPILRRRRTRARREFRSHLGALLFIRVPLFNPDRLLDALAPLASLLVSPFGAVLWLVTVGFGLWTAAGQGDRLVEASASVLDAGNLLYLYLTIALIKLAHELGHGLMLKALGRRLGGAHVYRVGVLLLLFLPFPYIDASGAWALPSKWQRAIVGAAGMIVELAIAAIAAVVWARAGDGTLVADLAYNALLAASVSTLIFNANPLMRYDGYHILSDLLETPNLASRASGYVAYLFKRYVFGAPRAATTAYTAAERPLFVLYAIASHTYRLFVYAFIALFVLGQQFALGVLLLVIAGVELIALPLWRFAKFLLTSEELATRRDRALLATACLVGLVLIPAFAVPLPRYTRLAGVVEPASFTPFYAQTEGTLARVLPTGAVADAGDRLATLEHDGLAHRVRILELEEERLLALRRAALRDASDQREEIDERLAVIVDELAFLRRREASMRLDAPVPGAWISALAEEPRGVYLRPGDALGVLVTDDAKRVRARVTQNAAGMIDEVERVSVRAAGASGVTYTAELVRFGPEEPGEPGARGVLVAEYRLSGAEGLRPGQRVVVRAHTGSSTLARRTWSALLRVFEQRGAS